MKPSTRAFAGLSSICLVLVASLSSCSPVPGGKSSKYEPLDPEQAHALSRARGMSRQTDGIAARAREVIHRAADSHLNTLAATEGMVKYQFRPYHEVIRVDYGSDPPIDKLFGKGKKISEDKSTKYTNAYRAAKEHLAGLEQQRAQLESHIAILREGGQDSEAGRLQTILDHCNQVAAAITSPPDTHFLEGVNAGFRLSPQDQELIRSHIAAEESQMMGIKGDQVYAARKKGRSRASTSRQ